MKQLTEKERIIELPVSSIFSLGGDNDGTVFDHYIEGMLDQVENSYPDLYKEIRKHTDGRDKIWEKAEQLVNYPKTIKFCAETFIQFLNENIADGAYSNKIPYFKGEAKLTGLNLEYISKRSKFGKSNLENLALLEEKNPVYEPCIGLFGDRIEFTANIDIEALIEKAKKLYKADEYDYTDGIRLFDNIEKLFRVWAESVNVKEFLETVENDFEDDILEDLFYLTTRIIALNEKNNDLSLLYCYGSQIVDIVDNTLTMTPINEWMEDGTYPDTTDVTDFWELKLLLDVWKELYPETTQIPTAWLENQTEGEEEEILIENTLAWLRGEAKPLVYVDGVPYYPDEAPKKDTYRGVRGNDNATMREDGVLINKYTGKELPENGIAYDGIFTDYFIEELPNQLVFFNQNIWKGRYKSLPLFVQTNKTNQT
ncbi:MAG: hypothetical protein EZS28_040956 [Streblomastix strix]|uniref:Uncharacterized protein n=1 Tax=Streblomastix strix TaxID=222440 RepID=A0A5J4TZ07_9EUKA|nr:MAG: hypothetical protein EZS28_040956 [Streblomastix strix]